MIDLPNIFFLADLLKTERKKSKSDVPPSEAAAPLIFLLPIFSISISESDRQLYFFGKEADNEDQALMMDIRKKDMINNLKVIITAL